jgi:hypothetical protein
MKKTMFTATLLAATFATLVGSCFSTGGGMDSSSKSDPIGEAAMMVFRGDHFVGQFAEYTEEHKRDQLEKARLENVRLPPPREPPHRSGIPGRPDWMNTNPSAKDIDTAIEAYEAALELQPSGTWKVPKNYPEEIVIGGTQGSPLTASMSPPPDGIEAKLENAKSLKREWTVYLAAAQRQMAQQQAAAQAEAARQAQERASRTVTEDMFEVFQLPNNTLRIIEYTGNVENLVIPPTLYGLRVTSITKGVFSGRWEIVSVTIPDSVTEIYEPTDLGEPGYLLPNKGVFQDCKNLTRINFGNGIRGIADDAFMGCTSLRTLVIPNTIINIGRAAFANCGLTELTFGNGVQKIDVSAFYGNNLTSITIPAGIKTIAGDAFGSSNKLQTVNIASTSQNIVIGNLSNGWTYVFEGPITRAIIPANVSADNMARWVFEDGLRNYYASQNRAAGTYVKNGPVWTR